MMKTIGALVIMMLLATGCRVYEEAEPCILPDGATLPDCSCPAGECPGVDTSVPDPGDDTAQGEDLDDEDVDEPKDDCTGEFYITDLDGNPAEKPDGSEAWIFDPEAFRHFNVEIDPDDWEWLQDNALTEEYVPCTVTIDGLRYHGAGIRFKGAWSTLEGCFDDEGNQICPKLSMKIRFNKFDPCGRFHGVRRLVFNAAVYDSAMMRERISYEVLRNAGLEGPRASHATLQINDEDPSVFVLIEAPDKEFIQARWAKDEGNLYKEVWPVHEDAWVYEHALKTNDSTKDVSRMVEFTAAVLGSTEESFSDDVAPFMDAGDMAWHAALARGIADDDGVIRFWCVGTNDEYCVNHNYYWYDEPDSIFRLIPWDMETTFYDKKAPEVIALEWWELPEDCEKVPFYIWEEIEDPGPNDYTPLIPPPCDPIIGRSIRSHPYAYLQGLTDVAAAMEVALENIPVYKAQIAAAMEADPRLWHDMEDWDDNLGWLEIVIGYQIEAINEVLAAR